MGLPATMRELLDRGGLILTANARAARALHLRYAEAKQGENASAWPSPRILDLHSWLAEQWQALLLTGSEGRVLLNELQEHALWERIIEPHLAGISLIEPARIAALAHEAYSLLAEYNQLARIDDAMWLPEPASEPESFRAWARSFQRECTRQNWLPRCQLIGAVTDALRWGMLTPPGEIGWLGFDRATPAQADLQSVLESLGVRQSVLTWNTQPQDPPQLYRAQSEKEESVACAVWAREQLAANPHARIGILMPDLESRRAELERDLYRLLSPAQLPITAGASPALPFEFSLGLPLAQVPLVHAALLLLRWLHRPLLQQEISWLLLSSTLGATHGARDAFAHLDRELRGATCAPPEMSLEAFLRHPQRGAPAVSNLHRDLSAMLRQYHRDSRDAAASEWVSRVSRLLHAARWGEHAEASSLLFQARDAWEHLLDSVATLDLTSRSLSFRKFLSTLERGAQETIFAAESTGAPVQVMGAYAASGQSFDAVWFLGATDTAWPIPGRPNPLLPLALQRNAGMPHVSPDEDSALAQRTMDRIADSAGEVIYSWAAMSDEAVQRPSSLVRQFASVSVTIPETSQPSITLEPVQDDRWIPFPGTAVVSGGQMPIQRQANCPFQSFVFHRLEVRELSIAGHGLSPAERGSLVHKVMERIWSKDIDGHTHLSSHSDLQNAIAAQTLRPLIAAHTEAAMRQQNFPREDAWQRAYLHAERERTVRLVLDWLEVEAQRQPFHVIEVEKKITLDVGGLALRVRADRIDQVPGGKLLIDYKTGEVSTAGWDGPRPDQPQLPLYAAFGNTPDLVGAVFAQTRWPKDKMLFKGRLENARANLCETLKDKDPLLTEPYTAETVEQWREVLVNLSASFVRGEAQIDPHIYPKSCQYCELHGLCRIAESRAFDDSRDAAEEEESE